MALVVLMLSPLAGSLSAPTNHFLDSDNLQFIEEGQTIEIPHQAEIWWDEDIEWWDITTLDMDRNGIHDSLQNAIGQVNVGVSYDHVVTEEDRELLKSLGFVINVELPVVNALLLGDIDSSQIWQLSEIDGVVMVERLQHFNLILVYKVTQESVDPILVNCCDGHHITPYSCQLRDRTRDSVANGG